MMKPTKPKKSNPEQTDEGWIPSPELLWQLISIAPLSWYEQLATIAMREGLIKTPTDWSGEPGDFVPGISLHENAEYLVEAKGIKGHEREIDLPLLWEQLIAADRAEINRDYRIDLPIIDSEETRQRFLNNELPMRIVMPALGVSVDVTAWEFLQALNEAAPGGYHVKGPSGIDHPALNTIWHWVKFADTVEGRMWAHEILAQSMDVASRQAPLMGEEYRRPINDAARAILRRHNYLHGPCERCGRKWWLANEPKRRGRPSLLLKNCPACVAMIKREQSTARSRRARTKK